MRSHSLELNFFCSICLYYVKNFKIRRFISFII